MTKSHCAQVWWLFLCCNSRRMKRSIITILLALPGLLFAQSTEATEKARQQVFEALTVADAVLEKPDENLTRGAWEALSYLEESDSLKLEDIQEAVPDYYNFSKGVLDLRLIDPQNKTEYGLEVKVPFRLTSSGAIELLDEETMAVKKQWQILYLDGNYLAMDMGDLRVFFVHTPRKE